MDVRTLETSQPGAQRSPHSEPLSLQRLLAERADLWRGQVETSALADGIMTGFAALDQALPWRGWPLHGLIEILTDEPGAGLALIMPTLARLGGLSVEPQAAPSDQQPALHRRHRQDRLRNEPPKPGWLLLVNPPLIPYAPALAAQGLDLDRLMVIDAPGQGAWVMEQGLRLGGCDIVVAWTASESGRCSRDQDAAWTTSVLRRLQLAAQSGSTLALLMRPAVAAEQSSPASLRLDCQPGVEGLRVSLRKLRGGCAGGHLHLAASPTAAMPAMPTPLWFKPAGSRCAGR